MLAPATRHARVCTSSDVRQPYRRMWKAYPAPATVLSQANLDGQGGLNFPFLTPSLKPANGCSGAVERHAVEREHLLGSIAEVLLEPMRQVPVQ